MKPVISYTEKGESKKLREEAFLALSGEERFHSFIQSFDSLKGFEFRPLASSTDKNFIIE